METAVNLLIRPPRNEYLPSQLGPTRFTIAGKHYKRQDLELVNSRNLGLRCSHWEPVDEERPAKRMGCVIYLHGNSGSRIDAAENVIMLLHCFHVTYFAFDFAGAGQSEGKYISLGYHEQDDVETVLAYLKSTDAVSNICLWGRSMGAVTALMYTAKAEARRAKGDEKVMVPSTLILDSPFSSLIKLIPEVVDSADGKGQYIKQIPKKVVGGLLGLGIPILRKAIKIRAEFDISDLEPIAFAPKCSVPAIFIQGRNDTLVRPHHTQLLYEAYGSAVKKRIKIEGGHNTGRGSLCFEEISSFLFASFFDDEERKTICGLDGTFPRLRANLDDLGVPHFLCRRLPYPLVKEEVVTFDSLVSVVIDHASVQLQQPFTGARIGEYKLGSADDNYSILGYGVEAIGGENDQKLFYIRVAEPYSDTDAILLFITTRADEISDILKLRIDALLREKLTNVNMASRIEQIVQKLVARRIDEQVAQNKRKREKKDEKHGQHGHEGGDGGGVREEQPFTFRFRRGTAKLLQAMMGNGSRGDDSRASASASATTRDSEAAIAISTSTSTNDGIATSTTAAAAISTTTASISTSATATTVAATQLEATDDEGSAAAASAAQPEAETKKEQRRDESSEERKDKHVAVGGASEATPWVEEVHVDENEIIGTIEEVLCEIGMLSEKDRPHLHAVISDSVREVIKRELENHRRTERERRERELELNKDRQQRDIDERAAAEVTAGRRRSFSQTMSYREKRAQKKLQQRQQHRQQSQREISQVHLTPTSTSTEAVAAAEEATTGMNSPEVAPPLDDVGDRSAALRKSRSELQVNP